MRYTYGISCTDDNHWFWKRVDADHKLNDDEKKQIIRAACVEEMVISTMTDKQCYDVPQTCVDGVMAAFNGYGSTLEWDDMIEDTKYLQKFPADKSFNETLDSIIRQTRIGLEAC